MIAAKNIFSTTESAYAVDQSGQIIAWNHAAEKAFGFDESEALGQQCWELLSGRDVFGNQSCCPGCPVRNAAFNNEPINRFQVDFKTASEKRKRFTVSTLMLLNDPGNEVFVHICHPESDTTENLATQSTVSKQPKTLTPRETECLTLLHKGLTVTDIAKEMSVSVATVRNHTQHILDKFCVHSRFEAVALGRKLNLI